MAFSDLCHISNAYKTVELENEVDQSDRIMEENSMVRDLITKILEDPGPSEACSSIPPPEKSVNSIPPGLSQYPNNDTGTSFMSSLSPYTYSHSLNLSYNYNEPISGYTFNSQPQHGFTNGFVNYPENDVNSLLMDPITEAETVTPEQLNLLRLAAQEIGGAQFTSPNKFDEKYYNFFEPNQRNSLPETNMFSSGYNRPNSLNLDMNYNSNYDAPFNAQRFPSKFENGYMKEPSQDSADLIPFLSQLNIAERREDLLQTDFKMPMDMNGYHNDDFNKMQEERNKLLYNSRSFQQPPNKAFNGESNFYLNDLMSPMSDRNLSQNYDYGNQAGATAMNFKPNGFNPQNDFVQRRDMTQMLPREGFQVNGNERTNYDAIGRENPQQALLRQQELARQLVMMRNRPPPNPLNVDVSFLHENTPFNLGLGALLGPSPPVPPPVIPSPMLDLPILAPFYAMRNMRGAATSSSILHTRLDACYEQWRQLERERKRTEARLALAYPGRAVSSSNSIPVPRLPPCPTRVDRLTVDMLREHTKVLTLMGKMETLRASVCVTQNKKPNKPEDGKITVLKRGQENVPVEKEVGLDPATFDPPSWREDVKHLAEIAPHMEVENAMLAWRNAVAAVQAARRRELAPHPTHNRYMRSDPILQLADAVKQLSICARRARCAMWCDLTLTVALAPDPDTEPQGQNSPQLQAQASPKQQDNSASNIQGNTKPLAEQKEPLTESQPAKKDAKQENEQKQQNKQPEKERNQRRTQNYRKMNQRNDFYPRNQRYDSRFVHNRHPYHYLATGPIN